jgi:hypothetical protein
MKTITYSILSIFLLTGIHAEIQKEDNPFTKLPAEFQPTPAELQEMELSYLETALPQFARSTTLPRYLPNDKIPALKEKNYGHQFIDIIQEGKSKGFAHRIVLFINQVDLDTANSPYTEAKKTQSRETFNPVVDQITHDYADIGNPFSQYEIARKLLDSKETLNSDTALQYLEGAAKKNFIPALQELGKAYAQTPRVMLELTRIIKEGEDGKDRKNLGETPTKEEKDTPGWTTDFPKINFPADLGKAYKILRLTIGKGNADLETNYYLVALSRIIPEKEIEKLEAELLTDPQVTQPYITHDSTISYFYYKK